MPSKSTVTPTIGEDAVRTRAYLMWEADGRPFGRDDHYWGLALAEVSTPMADKPKRAAATTAVPEKKAKAAAKPAPAKAKSKKK
jgi:hypothetical protein